MFLIPEDYKPYIRQEIKDDILLGDISSIHKAELASQSEMESYLSGRYDVARVFVQIQEYHPEKQFNEGDYVYEAGKIWKSLDNQSDVRPSENIQEENEHLRTWSLEDPRNPIIVLRMIYITLYHGHKALPGSHIPQLRVDDYDISIKWLEKVAAGTLNPLLPEAEKEDGGLVAWGGNPRRQVRY